MYDDQRDRVPRDQTSEDAIERLAAELTAALVPAQEFAVTMALHRRELLRQAESAGPGAAGALRSFARSIERILIGCGLDLDGVAPERMQSLRAQIVDQRLGDALERIVDEARRG